MLLRKEAYLNYGFLVQAAEVVDIRSVKPETARKKKRIGSPASEVPQQRQLATATDDRVQTFLKKVKVRCLDKCIFRLAGVLKPTLDKVKAAKGPRIFMYQR